MSETRRYWLVLFTGTTWQQFLEAGGRLASFREGRWPQVQQVQPGDCLLCYLTGVSRFIGALTVTGAAYFDTAPRLPVTAQVLLTPETAVPILELRERLTVLKSRNPRAWTARLRGSPNRWPTADGERVLEAVLDAQLNPTVRDVDPRRLARVPAVLRPLFLPDAAQEALPVNVAGFREPSTHTEIQYLLLKLGSGMGLDVWVARNDRGRDYRGQRFADIPQLLDELPRQFDEATMRIIELIDVLWLKKNAILAAFEIEHTSSVYSGLLRMADLVAMQPNVNIPLYLVAPDERRAKVLAEIARPAFSRLTPPLAALCRYIAYSTLRAKAHEVAPVLQFLHPDFIREIAETCPEKKPPGRAGGTRG